MVLSSNIIQDQAKSFGVYIDNILYENGVKELVDCVSNQVPLLVFSGIIRNFFLGYLNNRDIDFVMINSNDLQIPISLLRNIKIGKNKFDGYKLKAKNISIDCWDIKKTWGILHDGMDETTDSLLSTAFFNFSAIVYDYSQKKFLISDDFYKFLASHTMEVVYSKNPATETCIVNAIYYAEHFDFIIGSSLRRWILKNYNENLDFTKAQMSRFQQIIYSNQIIKGFVEICRRPEIYSNEYIRLYSDEQKFIELKFAQ